jgi:Family of unknown function (DUF6152)
MRFSLSFAAVCAVCLTVTASAHHSHGQYEETFRDIEGVVTEVHLVLPHSWVYIEVKDPKGGAPQLWALEATGRTQLEKMGVTREYLKQCDTIKARCHPLRDGSNGCLLGFLKARDGSVKNWDGGAVPALAGF